MNPQAIRIGPARVLPVPWAYWSAILFEPTSTGATRVRLAGYLHYARVRRGQRETLVTGLVPSRPADELMMARLVPCEVEAMRQAVAWLKTYSWRVVAWN